MRGIRGLGGGVFCFLTFRQGFTGSVALSVGVEGVHMIVLHVVIALLFGLVGLVYGLMLGLRRVILGCFTGCAAGLGCCCPLRHAWLWPRCRIGRANWRKTGSAGKACHGALGLRNMGKGCAWTNRAHRDAAAKRRAAAHANNGAEAAQHACRAVAHHLEGAFGSKLSQGCGWPGYMPMRSESLPCRL